MGNNAKLKKLMEEHELTRARVMQLTDSKKATVNSWLASKKAVSHRKMPESKMSLLMERLKNGHY